MKKRQYIFLFLVVILLYLSFKIFQFEYKKYTISNYIKEQSIIIEDIKKYLEETEWTIRYISTRAFKNKILKSEKWMKMKWEEVIVLTSEKLYNKFSGKHIIQNVKITKKEKEYNITSGMSNFEKWVYFLLKKDLRW